MNIKQSQSPEVQKLFNEWILVKNRIHFNGKTPKYKEGDVWWCGLGENVGVEINGKSGVFSRPVVILKKLSQYGFMGIPLTTKAHEGLWYVKFIFQGVEERAVLSQARTMSVSRLYKKIGVLPETDLKTIRQAFHNLYCTGV